MPNVDPPKGTLAARLTDVRAQIADKSAYHTTSSVQVRGAGGVNGRDVHCECVGTDDRITVYRVIVTPAGTVEVAGPEAADRMPDAPIGFACAAE